MTSTSGSSSRFSRVGQILDDSIGGTDSQIAFHGPFWRGLSRDQLVAMEVFGLPLLEVGHGAASNLVLALRGQAPFGADLPEPPPDSQFSRMPAGLPPVAPADIAFVETWIDDGCPEGGDVSPPAPTWRPTNAPVASSRTDDIWFRSPRLGWAVNSNGQILRTDDGGDTWKEQLHDPKVYFRCIGFATDRRGWAGTLSSTKRLFSTRDGGSTWKLAASLPPLAPSAICGLSVVNAKVVYASGTNHPNRPARMMKTVDGGTTWTAWDMAPYATILVDTLFTSARHGWVVGGRAEKANPTRADVRAVVLETRDGGRTWLDRLAGLSDQLPVGEWGWKIQFLGHKLGFVSLESFDRAAILKTTDGGRSWSRIPVRDPQGNVNLEGVGFVDERHGWVGGWGSADFKAGSSSETQDGGQTWTDANGIGRFLNRFRFLDRPVTVGFASGRTVYKYSSEPVPPKSKGVAPALRLLDGNDPVTTGRPLRIAVTVPEGAERLIVDIWDRFGELVRELVDEPAPSPGARTVEWDATDAAGQPLDPGGFLVRVTAGAVSESQVVQLTA